MIFSLISIVVLLALSAFFSASETAVISVSRAKLQKLKMDGNKQAIILAKLRGENKERFIGSILLGNNFVNIAASSIATGLSIELFGESGGALFFATAIMTFLILIYSEVLPKTYAVRNSEHVGLKVAKLCTLITKIFSPATFAIKLIVDKTLNLIVSKNPSHKNELSGLEVIRGAIDLHHEEGDVFTEDKFMLGGIIDLEEVLVEEVIVHRNYIKSVNIDAPKKDIIEKIINSPYSRMPIWRNKPENIIGIIHIRDFVKLLQTNRPNKITIDNILAIARDPWFIPNTTNLKSQLKAFRERHYHFALVVDEYGELLGLITLEDIVEEVVGQIEDEYDKGSDKIHIHSDNSVTINGDTTIRDLNREMNWGINDNHAATIGGLLLHEAQRVPELGEVVMIGRYKIKLLKKKRNKIIKVKVTLSPKGN